MKIAIAIISIFAIVTLMFNYGAHKKEREEIEK